MRQRVCNYTNAWVLM